MKNAELVTLIIRGVCEAEPGDPDHKDTVCIGVEYLRGILEACIETAIPRITEVQRSIPSVGDVSFKQLIAHKRAYPDAEAPMAQAAAVPEAVTDAMVDAYLKAQRETVEGADKFGRPNVGGLHTNTVREACRAGIMAALATLSRPTAAREAEPKSAQAAGVPDPTHTTEPGESLMGIALRQLGDETRWKEIRNLNADRFGMRAPHECYPVGTVLQLPAKATTKAGDGEQGGSSHGE